MKRGAAPTKTRWIGSIALASIVALITRLFFLRHLRSRKQAAPGRPEYLPQRTPAPAHPAQLEPDYDLLAEETVAARQRLQELEDLMRGQPGAEEASRARAGKISRTRLVLGVVLTLAAIPPALVVLDRWVDNQGVRELLQSTWCRSSFLCRTALPPYFALIFACFLGLIIFLMLAARDHLEDFRPEMVLPPVTSTFPSPQRKDTVRQLGVGLQITAGMGYLLLAITGIVLGRVPGWDFVLVSLGYIAGRLLEEIPVKADGEGIRRNLRPMLSVVLGQLALVLLLGNLFSGKRFEWAYAILLVLALISLCRNREDISPIFWVVSLAVVIYSVGIGSWRYAVIGDEYSFYSMARSIVEEQSIFEVGTNLFNGQAVYGAHPYFSSLLQAISMLLLGTANFGWRFSSLYLCALSAGFFYFFFKTFLSQRVAFVTAALLAVSHYLINFSKIGYNNLQALFMMSVALWMAGRALSIQRPIAFNLLGMVMGACLYVYPAALYALPLPVLLMLFYMPPTSRAALRRWLMMIASFSLTMLPLLFQPGYWQAKIAGTIFYNPDIVGSTAETLFHVGSNLLYTLFSFLYIPEESHFVVSSYVDPLTAVFLPIGLALILRWVRKERFAGFVAIGFIIEALLIGVSHDRSYPTATRMFMLLPWMALFGALGLCWVVDQARPLMSGRRSATALIAAILVATLGANLVQAFWLFPKRTEGIPSLEALFLRVLQYDHRDDPRTTKIYLFVTEPDWGIDGLRTQQEVYGVPDSQAQLLRVDIDHPGLPEWAEERIQEENVIVIVQPWMEEGLMSWAEAQLQLAGKRPCEVRDTPSSAPRFTMWLSPQMDGLCIRASSDG